MTRFLVALSALAMVTELGAQTPEFEVALVKPVDTSKLGDAISMNIGTVRREEVTFGNAMLNDCIRFAYGLASDAQIAGPDWIKSKQFLYDVVAKGAPGASRAQLQAMMQTLLAERFKLVTHREQKEMSYYALVLAKTDPRSSPSERFRMVSAVSRTEEASTASCRCRRWRTCFPASRESVRSSIGPDSPECTK